MIEAPVLSSIRQAQFSAVAARRDLDLDSAKDLDCESPLRNHEGKMALIGYARVSTNGQDYNGQIAELKAAGCERIFREKVSGARSNRIELGKLLKALGSGDVLIVTRLDRLAGSTLDLLGILRRVTEAGAKFRSLKDACDAAAAQGSTTFYR
jgi:DNA invertase Pin-like site-specific DNA recombinase